MLIKRIVHPSIELEAIFAVLFDIPLNAEAMVRNCRIFLYIGIIGVQRIATL